MSRSYDRRLVVPVVAVLSLVAAVAHGAAPPAGDQVDVTNVTGVVVDESGQAVAGANVAARYWRGEATGVTDSDGRFTLAVPTKRRRGATLTATAADGTLGFAMLPWSEPKPLRIVLKPARVIDATVVDREGKPATAVTVYVNANYRTIAEATTDGEGHAALAVPAGIPLQFVLADAGAQGVDYVAFRRPDQPKSDPYQLAQDYSGPVKLVLSPTRRLTVRVVDQDGRPVPGARVVPWYFRLPKKGDMANLGSLCAKETGAQGTVEYNDIPVEQERQLIIWVRKDGYVAKERTMIDTRSAEDEIVATLLPLVPVSGRVVHADGSPTAGVKVRASGAGYNMDDYRETATTAEDGSFRFQVNPDYYCMFAAVGDKWASPGVTRVVRPGQPVDDIKLTLQPATRVFGRLTTGDDDRPVPDEYVHLYHRADVYEFDLPADERLPNPKDSHTAVMPLISQSVQTDDAGRFELFTGPGKHYLIVRDASDTPEFTVTGQSELEQNLHLNRVVEGTVAGRVVLKSDPDQGVAEVAVSGYLEGPAGRFIQATSGADGQFEVRRSPTAEVVGAFGSDGALGAVVRVEPEEDSFVLALAPTATVHGTLIDDETGEPAAGREVDANVRVESDDGTFMQAFTQRGTTDDAGRFEIIGLVPGQHYRLNVITDRDSEGRPRSWDPVGKAAPARAESIDLGELHLEMRREPTLEERIAKAYVDKDAAEQLAKTLTNAELGYSEVLVIAADPESDAAKQFFASRYDDDEKNDDLQSALVDYMVLGISPGQTELLESHGIAVPEQGGATLAILSRDKGLVAQRSFAELAPDGTLDRPLLEKFLAAHRLVLPDAREELDAALATAGRENKRVLVQVGGPGCGWCIYLARYLDSQKELIGKDYVWLKIDSRMPHGKDVIGEVRKDQSGGIPWMAILAPDGSILVTSDSEEGNIGYPAEKSGKEYFEHMLRSTRQQLSDDQITTLISAIPEP